MPNFFTPIKIIIKDFVGTRLATWRTQVEHIDLLNEDQIVDVIAPEVDEWYIESGNDPDDTQWDFVSPFGTDPRRTQ